MGTQTYGINNPINKKEKYDNETKKRSLEGSKAIGTYN